MAESLKTHAGPQAQKDKDLFKWGIAVPTERRLGSHRGLPKLLRHGRGLWAYPAWLPPSCETINSLNYYLWAPIDCQPQCGASPGTQGSSAGQEGRWWEIYCVSGPGLWPGPLLIARLRKFSSVRYFNGHQLSPPSLVLFPLCI